MENSENKAINDDVLTLLSEFRHHSQRLLTEKVVLSKERIQEYEDLQFAFLDQLDALALPEGAFDDDGRQGILVEIVDEEASSAAENAELAEDEPHLFRNDGTESISVPITNYIPLYRGTTEIALRLSAVARDGKAYMVVWQCDGDYRHVAVDYCEIEEHGSYAIQVSEAARSILIGLRLEPGAQVEVGEVTLKGVSAGSLEITLENYRECLNPTVSDFDALHTSYVEMIPESNGIGYYDEEPPKVGIITDEFMYNYYSNALQLTYLSPVHWKKQIDESDLDFILYVSCWRGINPPDEFGKYEYNIDNAKRVIPLIAKYARSKNIPFVFQSIEDPPSYNLYLPIAREADFIFTSAVETIPDYVRDTGSYNVFYQPYGINPSIHNPVGFMKRRTFERAFYKDCIFFAGSWYSTFPKRCNDTKLVFESVLKSGWQLVLADRALDYLNRVNRVFPYQYNEFIIPPIEHKLLQRVHKLFDFAINMNSVTDSETMGAMRVYEVQALGSLLVSNYAKSLVNSFPDVCIVKNPDDFQEYISSLSEHDIVMNELAGIRNMFSNATVFDRLNLMLCRMGMPELYKGKTVYIVCDEKCDHVQEEFDKQTYVKKMLVSDDEFRKMEPHDGFAVFFSGDAVYDANLVTDAANAFKFVDVDYVNACEWNAFDKGYDYATGTQTKYGTLYSLRRLGPLDIDSVVENKMLEGFTIAL